MIILDSSGVATVFCASSIRPQLWRLICYCTVGTIARCSASGMRGARA
jgi:hypothetical protein